MRTRPELLILAALALAPASTARARDVTPRGDAGGRPHLELRATPSTAFSPATVMVVGKLVGGSDSEEFYCPAMEWDWGDGSRSTREGDCPPFDDETHMARLFSLRYRYRGAGEYRVTLTMRRGGRRVASASVSIRVLGREGDSDTSGIEAASETGGFRPSNARETNHP